MAANAKTVVTVGREKLLNKPIGSQTEVTEWRGAVLGLTQTRSSYAGALTANNPALNRKLASLCHDIDRKKRSRAAEMFMTQRKFFLKTAFDANDQLRFCRRLPLQASPPDDTSQCIPDDATCKTPAEVFGKKTDSSTAVSDVEHTRKKQPRSSRLERQLFLAPGEELSLNMDRIRRAESRLHGHQQQDRLSKPSFADQGLPRGGCEPTGERPRVYRGPSNTYIESSTQTHSRNYSVKSVDYTTGEHGAQLHIKKASEKDAKTPQSHPCSGVARQVKPGAPTQSKTTDSFPKSAKSKKKETIRQLDSDYAFLTFTDDCLETRRPLRHERLLRKLVQSLPVQILCHSDKGDGSLALTLGYEKRRDEMLHRERCRAGMLGYHSPKFTDLVCQLEH